MGACLGHMEGRRGCTLGAPEGVGIWVRWGAQKRGFLEALPVASWKQGVDRAWESPFHSTPPSGPAPASLFWPAPPLPPQGEVSLVTY